MAALEISKNKNTTITKTGSFKYSSISFTFAKTDLYHERFPANFTNFSEKHSYKILTRTASVTIKKCKSIIVCKISIITN